MSWEILKILKESGILKYDNLLHKIAEKTQLDKSTLELIFFPSVTFLYALGLVAYNQNQDYFEITKRS